MPVPARNEADRMPATLAALAEAFPGAAVVVADDGSRDGTADVAQAAGVELIRTGRRIGKGGAATLAVARLLAGGVERAVGLCDGDLGASARELSKLVDALVRGEGDLALAALRRPVGGGFGAPPGLARRLVRSPPRPRPAGPDSGLRA